MFQGWTLFLAMLATPADPSAGMGFTDARHLLSRTGFGGSHAETVAYANLTREEAVARLLDGLRTQPQSDLPAWASDENSGFTPRRGGMSPEERRELRRLRNSRGQELKGWWAEEMVETDSPLTERLTLFWHNHFTSSLRKVRSPHLLLKQNLLLRRHGAGNFAELLHAVSKDPAMVLYLDNQRNNKRQPNENYAREVMELFTLGEGHYTEQDIREAARAFTGWKVGRRKGEFHVVRREHDAGPKSFLGKTGNFDGHHILDIILSQPRVATFITEKLWREFISDQPDPQEITRLAGILREGKYELKPLLRALFLSASFWHPKVRGTLVKSPAELVVGTVRLLGGTELDGPLLAAQTRRMGQDLFDPPNVKGWPGNIHWITSATLLVRDQFLTGLLSRREKAKNAPRPGRMGRGRRLGVSVDLTSWFSGLAPEPKTRLAIAQCVLLPLDPLSPIEEGDTRSVAQQLLLDPTFQLK